MSEHPALEKRWQQLLTEAGLEDRGDRVIGELLSAYSESTRGHHNTLHLLEVLEAIDELTEDRLFTKATIIAAKLAAFFHDAIYKISGGDSEELSAKLAEARLPEMGANPDLSGEVGRLVRLTEKHLIAKGDLAGALLSDADMAILAAPEERYKHYAQDVQDEYVGNGVPLQLFQEGREVFLYETLEHSSIFHLPQQEKWETRARGNMGAELEVLEALGS